MQTILVLLLTAFAASAQTTYTVLSTTSGRTIVGGVTNLPHLNSNNVFTGTMRATGAVTLTNASNVFGGDGSALTGISAGVSKTNGSATNLSVYSSGTTNRPLRVFGTNGYELSVDKDGRMAIDSGSITIGGARVDSLYGTLVSFSHYLSGAGTGDTDVYARAFVGDYLRANNTYLVCPSTGRFDVSSASVYGELRDLGARSLYTTNLYATNFIVGGGAAVTGILSATATLNFDLTALTVEDLTITVTGAADGDVVTLGVPNGSVTTSVQYTAWVSAADTVTVRARTSAAGENPASGTFRATIFKH